MMFVIANVYVNYISLPASLPFCLWLYGIVLSLVPLVSYWVARTPKKSIVIQINHAENHKKSINANHIYPSLLKKGPRMSPADGRVVSNFIIQALKGEQLTIYGDGLQTRSFQYIHDLIDGLILLMNKNFTEPINLGNPEEYSIREFAEMIRNRVSPDTPIKHLPATMDDPKKRKPDVTRAITYLGWRPAFSVQQGLEETIEWFKEQGLEALI